MQGQCFVALDPSAFAPGFTDRMSDIMTTLRNMTPVSMTDTPIITSAPQPFAVLKPVH